MRAMMNIGAAFLAGYIFSGTVEAAVVLGRVGWSGPSSGLYALTKQYTTQGVPYEYIRFEAITVSTIESSFITLGDYCQVYVVSAGTEFTAEYAATHTAIIENMPPYGIGTPVSYTHLTLPTTERV